jgi:hypothetical protein
MPLCSHRISRKTNFTTTMISFLTNLASVQRYAYFVDINGIIIDGNNQLTTLGSAHAHT